MGLGKMYVLSPYFLTPSMVFLTHFSSVRVRGEECGIEALMLGCVTSIGGFLFGYDTVRVFHR